MEVELTVSTYSSIVDNDHLFYGCDPTKLILKILFQSTDAESKDTDDVARVDIFGSMARLWRWYICPVNVKIV